MLAIFGAILKWALVSELSTVASPCTGAPTGAETLLVRRDHSSATLTRVHHDY